MCLTVECSEMSSWEHYLLTFSFSYFCHTAGVLPETDYRPTEPTYNTQNSGITRYLEDILGFYGDTLFKQVCLNSYQRSMPKL